jgi:hypothetical protein
MRAAGRASSALPIVDSEVTFVVIPCKPHPPAPTGLRPNGPAPAPRGPWPADTRIAVAVWPDHDRLMVRVVDAVTNQEIACWWDDDARGLVDAGFLDPRD